MYTLIIKLGMFILMNIIGLILLNISCGLPLINIVACPVVYLIGFYVIITYWMF